MARQEPLRSIGQRFAGAINPAVMGWDQAISIRKSSGHGQTGCACRYPKSGGDQFAAREIAHCGSLRALTWPVIIARMRFVNPARLTITIWIRRKSTRNTDTKKWIVRADCWPPSTMTAPGNADAMAGDIARPVQITKGNRTKITDKYVSR